MYIYVCIYIYIYKHMTHSSHTRVCKGCTYIFIISYYKTHLIKTKSSKCGRCSLDIYKKYKNILTIFLRNAKQKNFINLVNNHK